MVVFRYDKTFEGLLTALFDAYSRRTFPERLLGPDEPLPMFAGEEYRVATDRARADRVWRGFLKKSERRICNLVMHVWLSEEPGSDELIFRYMRKTLDSPGRYWENYADPDVVAADRIARKVACEGEHVRQFVRFQKGGDGTFFAPIEPLYNALPLAVEYLTDRFADQKWLVYDTRRHYGYYYDLHKAVEVTMEDDAHLLDGKLSDELMAADEKLFQQMWRSYFKAVTIRERANPRLQRQHMPRRFWKFLTEKQ